MTALPSGGDLAIRRRGRVNAFFGVGSRARCPPW